MDKIILTLSFAIIILLSFDSCKYEKGDLVIVTPCDSTDVSYTNQINDIIDINCIHCHNAIDVKGGLILETYEEVKESAVNGQLLPAIRHDAGAPPMPKDKYPNKMDPCSIRVFEIWVEMGTPEN